jgi:hypothetical protein
MDINLELINYLAAYDTRRHLIVIWYCKKHQMSLQPIFDSFSGYLYDFIFMIFRVFYWYCRQNNMYYFEFKFVKKRLSFSFDKFWN